MDEERAYAGHRYSDARRRQVQVVLIVLMSLVYVLHRVTRSRVEWHTSEVY